MSENCHGLFWKNTYLSIWLCRVCCARGVLDLCCGMRVFSCSMWDLVPWPGSNPGPVHGEHRVLAPGPPGKSQTPYGFCWWEWSISTHAIPNSYTCEVLFLSCKQTTLLRFWPLTVLSWQQDVNCLSTHVECFVSSFHLLGWSTSGEVCWWGCHLIPSSFSLGGDAERKTKTQTCPHIFFNTLQFTKHNIKYLIWTLKQHPYFSNENTGAPRERVGSLRGEEEAKLHAHASPLDPRCHWATALWAPIPRCLSNEICYRQTIWYGKQNTEFSFCLTSANSLTPVSKNEWCS